MKLVFLSTMDGGIIALNPNHIIHVDQAIEKGGRPIIGMAYIYVAPGLTIKVRGTVKEVALSINKQLEELKM